MRSGLSLCGLDEPGLHAAQPSIVLTQTLCSVCAVDTGEVVEVCHRLASQIMSAASPTTPIGCEPSARPQVVSLEPGTIAQVAATFSQVGELCGAAEAGLSLEREFLDRLSSIRAACSTDERQPRMLMLEWLDPPYDGGHWIPEMIETAGCSSVLNVAGAKSRERSWADVATADPDIIVVACCGFDLERNYADALRSTELAATRAAAAGRCQ